MLHDKIDMTVLINGISEDLKSDSKETLPPKYSSNIFLLTQETTLRYVQGQEAMIPGCIMVN